MTFFKRVSAVIGVLLLVYATGGCSSSSEYPMGTDDPKFPSSGYGPSSVSPMALGDTVGHFVFTDDNGEPGQGTVKVDGVSGASVFANKDGIVNVIVPVISPRGYSAGVDSDQERVEIVTTGNWKVGWSPVNDFPYRPDNAPTVRHGDSRNPLVVVPNGGETAIIESHFELKSVLNGGRDSRTVATRVFPSGKTSATLDVKPGDLLLVNSEGPWTITFSSEWGTVERVSATLQCENVKQQTGTLHTCTIPTSDDRDGRVLMWVGGGATQTDLFTVEVGGVTVAFADESNATVGSALLNSSHDEWVETRNGHDDARS